MSSIAAVQDGKFVESTSQSSLSTSKTGASSDMDKDSFLQLLVAQMKYQDPLQPTSNTEYISQYAQFSQVEQMQNMASGMDLQRASSLVGQEVSIKTVSSSGEVKTVEGKVDYVVYENSKAYLSIGGELYSMDDLEAVADSAYLLASDLATAFTEGMDSLPAVDAVDLSYQDIITTLATTYNNMTEYQREFITEEQLDLLTKYVDKLNEVLEAAGLTEAPEVEGEGDTTGDGDTTGEGDGTEGAGSSEGDGAGTEA